MKLFLIFFMILLSGRGWSYANFIGHGYPSCINCHFNPFGNGQLTDYGRAVSATAISAKTFYPKSWNEEKIAYTSGFLFRKPKPVRILFTNESVSISLFTTEKVVIK